MRELSLAEIDMVVGATGSSSSGGGGTAPTCTTNTVNGQAITTCSCPAGTSLTVETSGNTTKLTCK